MLVGQSDNGATTTDGKADGNAKTSANNAQVNRVSFAPEVSSSSTYRQLDFDISGMSDLQSFSGFHVNMVSNLIQTTTKTTVSDGRFRKFAAVINSFSVRVEMRFMVFRSMFAV